MMGRVLAVGESDATGASGIQADIKTILALGGYATTAISALHAGTAGGAEVSSDFITFQMRTALADIGVDSFKVGYLPDVAAVNVVADILDEYQDRGIPVVIDPSIVARDGCVLVDDKAVSAWKRRLYVRATVLTPNMREAELLTGMEMSGLEAMRHAASMMRTLGVEHVVLKAGQALGANKAAYFVASEGQEVVYERPMLNTKNTLGAGGTLSAGIALGLAQGLDVHAAVNRALDFVHEAILSAAGQGPAPGPIDHGFVLERRDLSVPAAAARKG